ncbi:hypothetical protein, partial [Sphingomonas trueperi]|uniref:hypothetical protein n=1 Tax=Sphingomonas trueperi TaxID=53317 RepID=UPI0031D9487D
VNPKAAPKCATTFVKSIMDRLGLRVHKRKSGGTNWLSISEDSWEEVMYYVRLRAARGVHSLTTHEAASTHTPMPAPERDTPREPSNDAACSQSDTLHGGVAAADEKYPSLAENKKLYAAAVAASKPLSLATPLREVMRWLAPAIKRQVIDGQMSLGQLEWTLDYCSQRIAKALTRAAKGQPGLPASNSPNTVH